MESYLLEEHKLAQLGSVRKTLLDIEKVHLGVEALAFFDPYRLDQECLDTEEHRGEEEIVVGYLKKKF